MLVDWALDITSQSLLLLTSATHALRASHLLEVSFNLFLMCGARAVVSDVVLSAQKH